MIKILPTGASSLFSYGMKPTQNERARPSFGRRSEEYLFESKSSRLRASWLDTHIEAILETKSELFVRSVKLIFRFSASRSNRDLAVWTESYSGKFKSDKTKSIPGTLSVNARRKGAWAMWISESTDLDGLFLRQNYPANYPILFECKPLNHTLSITWEINHRLETAKTLKLPSALLSRGPMEKLVSAWIHEWRVPNSRVFPQNERLGWCDSGELKTQKILLEILSALRRNKIKTNWIALGPQYAAKTGDWLTSKNSDRMNLFVRTIMEQDIAPGLRLAPFLASKKSSIATEKRNWFVRDEKGMPITVRRYGTDRDNCYVLDLSNPRVLSHIRKTFSLLREKWGFRTFYLERLGESLLPGLRHGKATSDLLNGAAMAIREAVGSRRLLIAEDPPLLATHGIWDAQMMTRPIEGAYRTYRQIFVDKQRAKMVAASALLHRSAWNESSWINTAGLLPISLFTTSHDTAARTLLTAIALSCGLVSLSGDPREIDTEAQKSIRDFLSHFAKCRKGRVSLMSKTGNDINDLLVARNNRGWIALFNFSDSEASIHLDTEILQTQLGAATPLSTGKGVVFNAPEIHVVLPPRGHRLFRG